MIVRADCNHDLGYGHVVRTLTIAGSVGQRLGLQPVYAMARGSDPGPVQKAGYQVVDAWEDSAGLAAFIDRHPAADGPWLLDNYDLDAEDLNQMSAAGLCTAMLDDGCRLEFYPCDVVIDSSPSAPDSSYRGSPETRFCLGAEYFPLRPEFLEAPAGAPTPGDIVITFGGSDPDDQTARVLGALQAMEKPPTVTAILGPGYTGRARQYDGVNFVENAGSVVPYFRSASVAVCGGGGTALELAHLGVPTIIIAVADNQVRNGESISANGAGRFLGLWDKISDFDVCSAVESLIADAAARAEMSAKGRTLVDGRSTDRIVDAIVAAWTDRVGQRH